nr:site-specific DNA-methyltransferase [Campylobacter troglodytis]
MIERMIRASSKQGDLVLDLFSGKGLALWQGS